MARALSSLSPKASFLPAQLTPLGNHELAEAGGGGASVVYTSCFDQHRAHFFRETVVVFLPSEIHLLEDSLRTAESQESGAERV